jgi:hypothetical protein
MEYVLKAGIQAGVKRLALFHHEPVRKDSELDTIERAIRRRAARVKSHRIDAFFAREGLEIEL